MMTWKEKLIESMSVRNQNGNIQWFDHKTIRNKLVENEKDGMTVPVSLSSHILDLIRTGHIERAAKPLDMYTSKYYGRTEYLYRWTGKKYKACDPGLFVCKHIKTGKLTPEEFNLSRELYWRHRKLPKWFRKMMM